MGWEQDKLVRQMQAENQDALRAARTAYAGPANERLQYIAQGGSPSPFASPWLSMKQAYQEYMNLQPAERAMNPGDARLIGSPQSVGRDARWDKAVHEAQLLQGTGQKPKTFVP